MGIDGAGSYRAPDKVELALLVVQIPLRIEREARCLLALAWRCTTRRRAIRACSRRRCTLP